MIQRTGILAAGACGSVLAHVAMLSILAVTMRPDPVAQQQTPKTDLDIQAYQLDRVKVPERQPDRERAKSANANAPTVAPGAIPQARARPVAAKTERLTANVAETEQLRASPPPPKLQRSQKLVAAALPPTTVRPSLMIGSRPDLQRIQAALPALVQAFRVSATGIVAVAHDPVVPAASATEPRATEIVPEPAPSVPVSPTVYAPEFATLSPQQSEQITATLAFAGTTDDEIDPVSVAAFQSFVRPGDVMANGDTLRDGVASLLAQVPCSRLQVGFDPDTATLQVNGHIPEDSIRAPVLAALKSRMGADISLSDNTLILPRPQCGALSGIANVGLPQSTDQITNPLLIGKDTHARVLSFVTDERLFFDLTAPEYDAFVYVDYFDADGNVLHLVPNDQVSLRLVSANAAFRVGARHAEEAGLQILIGPPYGREIAVAFAASTQLYGGLRPLIEPAAPYLEWLKQRVSDARNNDETFKGEWVYFFVTTAEK